MKVWEGLFNVQTQANKQRPAAAIRQKSGGNGLSMEDVAIRVIAPARPTPPLAFCHNDCNSALYLMVPILNRPKKEPSWQAN